MQHEQLNYFTASLVNPTKTGLLLAYTRAECDELNKQVRMLLKEKGLIDGSEVNIGSRNFSERDKMVFLKNDRENKITTFCPKTNTPVEFLIKNGTRGQILKIKEISLPESDCKTPKAYEFTVKVNDLHAKFNTFEYDHITHGYASTLHKAQGKTVDWSIILISRYMDAFATYVALTRHRDTTTLYYAKDVFANFRDLQKSLARVSNKDLALDYTISPQNYDFWENIQEYKLLGQDLIATIKSNDWESYNDLKSEQTAIGKIILANWDQHQLFARQAGVTSESIAINCGLKARSLSLAELAAQDTVKLYSEKAIDARNLWRTINKAHPGIKCYEHPSYQDFTKLRIERNTLAANIINNKALHKEWLAKSRVYGWRALEAQAKQGSSIASNITPLPIKVSRQIEPAQVKLELQQNIASIATTFLGEPTNKNAKEWRYGQKGSISISVAGVKQGLYANFEVGSYGGPLKLIQDQLNLDHKEAYKWALNWLGYSNNIQKSITEKVTTKVKEKIIWTPVFPVPKEHHDPKLSDGSLSYQLIKNNRHEVARFAYKDLNSNLLGYTVRLENQDGDKVILPLTYCQNSYGKCEWRWQGFGDNRTLYGLDKLSQAPSKPILIVEGEKTADAAQRLFSEMNVVSWCGGAGSINKIDWSPLVGKKITLWPDNDPAGINAMEQITKQLINLGENNVYQVQLPKDLPLKWDLADPLPNNCDIKTIKSLLKGVTLELPNEKQDRAENLIMINKIIQKYGFRDHEGSKDVLLKNVQTIYRQIVVLNAWVDPEISSHSQTLLEKAVLTVMLDHKIMEHNTESHLSSHLQSKNIALIAAEIMQKNHIEKPCSIEQAIKDGHTVYNGQQRQMPDVIEKLLTLHPESSTHERTMLAEQMYLCKNMLGKSSLPFEKQQQILTAAREFENFKSQGKIKDVINDLSAKQFLKSYRETAILEKSLELNFMEQYRIQKLEQKSQNFDQHKQLDAEHRLMAARDATNVLYHDINHQHALEVQLIQQKELEMQRRQQQRILNKDQELER